MESIRFHLFFKHFLQILPEDLASRRLRNTIHPFDASRQLLVAGHLSLHVLVNLVLRKAAVLLLHDEGQGNLSLPLTLDTNDSNILDTR